MFRPGPEEAFVNLPPMTTARSGHACALLPDGRVLVAGGEAPGESTAEVYDPALREWAPINSSLNAQRGPGTTATPLIDGRVLIVGGLRPELEIFDPDTNTLEPASVSLPSARSGHTATLLGDGRVLLAGGRIDGSAASSTLLFNAATSSLIEGPALNRARSGHTATLLFGGRVLIAGGAAGTEQLAELETFKPGADLIELLEARLATPRENHVAVLLPKTGGVLLAGGLRSGEALATSEMFEPWHDRVSPVGALTAPREQIAAVALEDGSVLATGGKNAEGSSRSCGVLGPSIRFVFTQTRYLPGQRAAVEGSFSGGSSLSPITVTLRLSATDLSTGALVVVGDRLITTSVTSRSDGTLPLTPIIILNRSDIGRDFVLTAFNGREALIQARFTVRLATALRMSTPTPVFTGQPVQARLSLTADDAPVDFGGTLTFVAGTRSAAQIGLSSVQTSRQADMQVCCESSPTVIQTSARYSGNVFLDPSSTSGSIAIASRIPTVRIAPTSLRLLQPSTVLVEVLFDQGAIDRSNLPTGNITLRNNGVAVATLPIAHNLALDSGASHGALFSFTPSLVDRRKPPCFTASYQGDPRYVPTVSASTCISVGPAVPTLQVSVGPSTTYTLGVPQTLTATLTWPDSVGIVGRTVTISRQTTQLATINLTPDPTGRGFATGSASVTLPFQADSLLFTYPESGDLGSATSSVRIFMAPVSTTMTATVTSPTGNPFSISYQMRINSGGVALPGGTQLGAAVQFFDGPDLLGTHTPSALGGITDGTSNTLFIGEPPVFRGTLTNVIRPLGPRTIRVRFPGSALFQASEVSVPVTIQ
jgi:hypothetical protein